MCISTVGWPLWKRALLAPILLPFFAITAYLAPCFGVYIRRFFTLIARGCCGLCSCLKCACVQNCLHFTDKSFTPSDASLGPELAQKFRGQVVWKRLGDFGSDEHRYKLFSNGVEPNDVMQGAVGDCWLVSVLCTLAAKKGAIPKLFITRGYSTRGKYKIRLFDVRTKKWTVVVIDDYIPTKNGQPLFAKPHGEELWAMLLEKAIAKYCGSYSNISGGFEGWGFYVLTGSPHVMSFSKELGNWKRADMKFAPTKEDARKMQFFTKGEAYAPKDFWPILWAYTNGHGALCCSISGETMEAQRADGLIETHSYSLLRVVEVDDKKLLKIRNPWGAKGEFTGAWSDGSAEWDRHPIIKRALNVKNTDDGSFWMSWEDFQRIWDDVVVCARTLDASDLVLDVKEDLHPCIGPLVGCVAGCAAYWCGGRCCRVICPTQARKETIKGERPCCTCVCCV